MMIVVMMMMRIGKKMRIITIGAIEIIQEMLVQRRLASGVAWRCHHVLDDFQRFLCPPKHAEEIV